MLLPNRLCRLQARRPEQCAGLFMLRSRLLSKLSIPLCCFPAFLLSLLCCSVAFHFAHVCISVLKLACTDHALYPVPRRHGAVLREARHPMRRPGNHRPPAWAFIDRGVPCDESLSPIARIRQLDIWCAAEPRVCFRSSFGFWCRRLCHLNRGPARSNPDSGSGLNWTLWFGQCLLTT